MLGCCALTVSHHAVAGEALVPCWYVAAAGEAAGEFARHPGCAGLHGSGAPTVAADHLAAVAYDEGLATLLIDGRWFYVDASGTMLEVLAYDNGADSWSSGLVRSPQEGKIQFFDRSLKPAFGMVFDWAWPFEGDHALVCQGCRLEPPDGDEHRAVVGGAWGVIDRDGRPVVPIEHSRDEAMRRFQDLRIESADGADCREVPQG